MSIKFKEAETKKTQISETSKQKAKTQINTKHRGHMVTPHPSSESSTECTTHWKKIAVETNAPPACTNTQSSPMPQTTLVETLDKSHSKRTKQKRPWPTA
jgi:hypothetical protein